MSATGRPEREHRSAQREGGEAPALPATAAARRLVAFYENLAPADLARLGFYENLAPADLARLGDLYAPNAYFRDPFNEVRGVEAIERIFADMFENLDDCRFRIASGRESSSASTARATCASMRRVGSATTATTGTRPKSSTPSCR